MHSGGFRAFERISFVVKGVNVSCFCGSTVEEFRQYVNEASCPGVLRFFCTHGQWSRDISYMLTGRHIPVILVYLKYEDEGRVDRNQKKNRKQEKKHMIPWEESLTKCFIEIECDCVVVNGTNVVGCENLNSLGISDVVLSVGYNKTTGNTPLGNNMSRLYDKLIPPKDSAGVAKRGHHVMKRFGFRACANVMSRGQVGKYASILCSEDRQEVDSLCEDVANSMWAHARAMFSPLLAPFGFYPGSDVPMIAIGATPFSAGYITCNAQVPSHLDPCDDHGTVIAWSNKGDVHGGGFYLTEYFLRFRLHHDTVVFCRSCTHEHGSLAPDRGDGARYGVALVNKKATSTRARKQVANIGLPLPQL